MKDLNLDFKGTSCLCKLNLSPWCHTVLRKFFSKFFCLMINWLPAYFITQGIWFRGGGEGEEFDDDLMQQYIIATTAFFFSFSPITLEFISH